MKSKSTDVYNFLEDQIMKGILAPGDKLPSETQLSRQFDISRVPVRAALDKLCAIGLVYKKKGGGSFVKEQNIDNFMNIFLPTMMFHSNSYIEMLELRQALDTLSVKLCLRNHTHNNYDKLTEIVNSMEAIDDSDSFFELDRQFHETISELADNKLLHNINLLLWDLLRKYSKEEYHLIGNEERKKEHLLIYKYILENDVELAGIYSFRHLNRTIKAVSHSIKKDTI